MTMTVTVTTQSGISMSLSVKKTFLCGKVCAVKLSHAMQQSTLCNIFFHVFWGFGHAAMHHDMHQSLGCLVLVHVNFFFFFRWTGTSELLNSLLAVLQIHTTPAAQPQDPPDPPAVRPKPQSNPQLASGTTDTPPAAEPAAAAMPHGHSTHWGLYKTQRMALLVLATLIQHQQFEVLLHLVKTGQSGKDEGLCQRLLELVDSVTRGSSGRAWRTLQHLCKKEKFKPLGVMTGASVPRSSPRPPVACISKQCQSLAGQACDSRDLTKFVTHCIQSCFSGFGGNTGLSWSVCMLTVPGMFTCRTTDFPVTVLWSLPWFKGL